MMFSRKIICGGCKKEGEIEILGLPAGTGPELLFRYLGHHEFTGNMYFCCPHCGREVMVNPMETLGPGLIKGVPQDGIAGRHGLTAFRREAFPDQG